MIDRRTFMATAAGAGVIALSAAIPAAATQRTVTAITQVFGDGQKLTAIAVEFDREIVSSALSTATFTVTNRTVTKVYANTRPDIAQSGRNGRYVIIELSTSDAGALLWVTNQGGGGPPTVGDNTPGGTITAASATLTQTGTVLATDGTRYPASGATLTTNGVLNQIVDEFRQFTFHDPATGQTLNYNLFVPRNYDPRRRYPLVLFMHDASVVNVPTIGPLVQGLGAVCWASPEDQAKRECFVLAPEYPSVVIDDNYEPSTLFDATVHLVHDVAQRYGVDRSRLYTTGQSMGAMLSLGMDIRYPGLFAASFIVAGQWPSAQAAPLATARMWVVVAQDDTKAYPMENAIMQVIEAAGTKVTTAVWDGRSTPAQFAEDVRTMEAAHTPVNYAAFATGTDVPVGSTLNPHLGTWQIAYTIPAIRDWIMRHRS